MLTEHIKARGVVSFVLTDEAGQVREQQDHNLVVNAGLAYIASRMRDATATAMSHMAVGTGSTTAAGAQTAEGRQQASPGGQQAGLCQ